jgi:hypothetical protein
MGIVLAFRMRSVIPAVLFMAPMAALHALDQSFGNERGDWAGGILLLAVISLLCGRREMPSAGIDYDGDSASPGVYSIVPQPFIEKKR